MRSEVRSRINGRVVWRMRLVILAAVLAAPCRVQAAPAYVRDAAWGAAAFGATLVYGPLKLGYALVGGLVGGLAFALTIGNEEAAARVLSPSLGGTYVITPAILRGEEPLLVSGETLD